MINFTTPKWVQKHLHEFENIEDIPNSVFKIISESFQKLNAANPLVSVVCIAYNEEKNVLKALSSLSIQQSKFPIEVIFVNNNSSDKTQQILDKCGALSVFQPLKGCGNARQAGLAQAKGKYVVSCDADTIYPPQYVQKMVEKLETNNLVAGFGMYSFLADGAQKRWKLAIYEIFRDLVIKLRSKNRPELAVGGASFAFLTELGLKVGWRTDLKRGEDGMMLMGLKKFGNVQLITTFKTRAWTTSRTLDSDGGFFRMIGIRIKRELLRISEYFTPQTKEYQDKDKNILN